MKKSIVFLGLLLLFTLSSCFRLYFDQPQPKDGILLTSVPEELQGTWSLGKITSEGDSTTIDTFYIDDLGIYSYIFDTIGQIKVRDGMDLSDSLLLFKAGDYYVANFSEDLVWWEVEIIHRHENGDIYFYYPSTVPYFGKKIGLKVVEIDEVIVKYGPDSTYYEERVPIWNKKLRRKNVFQRNAVYYSGQFKIRHIKKVLKEENLLQIFKSDGTIEDGSTSKNLKVSATDEDE